MIGKTADRMQRGWSMIELLIAMSIMIAVLTLVGTALLTGRTLAGHAFTSRFGFALDGRVSTLGVINL